MIPPETAVFILPFRKGGLGCLPRRNFPRFPSASFSSLAFRNKIGTKTARRAQENNSVIKYSRKRKGKQDKPLPQRFVAKAVIKKNEKLKRLRMEPKIISHDASFEKSQIFRKKTYTFNFRMFAPKKIFFEST